MKLSLLLIVFIIICMTCSYIYEHWDDNKAITFTFDEHYFEVGDIIASDNSGELFKVTKVFGKTIKAKPYRP